MSDRDIERRTRELRNMVFEETKERCAKVAEKHEKPRIGVADIYYPVADAIRALKATPGDET